MSYIENREVNTTVSKFVGNPKERISFGDNGEYVKEIRDYLNTVGFDTYRTASNPNLYDVSLENAVKEFQSKYGLFPTGAINDETLNKLINQSNLVSGTVYSSTSNNVYVDTMDTDDPHYDSFFSRKYSKKTRKNNQNIIITLGNNTIHRKLHNVYMRSVSVEFDTSGNPISEVFSFIAQDLTESDEPYDANKY